jgi:hypothetical protein
MSNGDIQMDQSVLSFTQSILAADKNQDLDVVIVYNIVEKRHCGNGYFSMDGIFDDLEAILGFDRASEIFSNC